MAKAAATKRLISESLASKRAGDRLIERMLHAHAEEIVDLDNRFWKLVREILVAVAVDPHARMAMASWPDKFAAYTQGILDEGKAKAAAVKSKPKKRTKPSRRRK